MNTTLLNLTENAALRGMLVEAEGVDEKDKWWFSVYDFIAYVCGKEGREAKKYAQTTFTNLVEMGSEHSKEVTKNVGHFQFPGQGQRLTPCMTIKGLQRLLMILGGRVAAEYRAIAEGIFTRYTGGDPSLFAEIRANAASNAPLNQACRAALEQEPVTGKRKEMEDLDVSERIAKTRILHIDGIKAFAETMSMLDADWKQDARLVRQTKDVLQNAVCTTLNGVYGGGAQLGNPNGLAIDNGELASITVSGVAQSMCVRMKPGDAAAIGKAAKQAYTLKYGEAPSLHKQWVDGAERLVCSYTERDRGLLEEAVLAHQRAQSTRSKRSGDSNIAAFFQRAY